MSSQETILKSYQKILKDNVKTMLDNYTEVVKLAHVEVNESNNYLESIKQQEQYEMEVRAANICKASEELIKLIYNIKQFLIINDFPLINDAISSTANLAKAEEIDKRLQRLRDEVAVELFELEDDYYSNYIKY